MNSQIVVAFNRLCLVLLLIASNAASPEVTVTLSTGKVTGLKLVSAVNKVYYSFQGIPYAAPPIGYLRFKPPRPPQPWNNTLKAFYAQPACAQPWRRVHFPEKFSEDCLYINVFTPFLEPPEGVPLAVMVWIHGGGHYQGSSSKYEYGPDFLLTGGVIVVTLEYRLGAFGYLNMNTKSAQGNAGLKDIVVALRWVRREIKHFGGDPDRVTIFGGSSGGQAVSCLYLSPLAQGLFHRVIGQSARSCEAVRDAHATHSSRALARLLGCDYRKPEASVACLRGVTAQVLAEAQLEVVTPGPWDDFDPFLPSVEEDHGEPMVLPLDPGDLLRISTSRVPYLLGLNSGEGITAIRDPREYPNQFCDLERDFIKYIPNSIKEKSSEKALQYIVKVLKKFYFHNKSITVDKIDEYVNFLTDKELTYDLLKYAKSLSTHGPVYLYLFAFQGAFEKPHRATEGMNLTGVCHGSELGYLFFRNSVIESHNHMSNFPLECEIVTKMVTLWTNFAKYGNPTPRNDDPLLETTWLPMNATVSRHLVINQTLVMNSSSLYPERMAVWDEVYEIAEEDITEASYTIGITIVAAVSVLSLASLTFLLYDCCCRKRDHYQVL